LNKDIHRHLSNFIKLEDTVLDLGCGVKDYSNIATNTTTVDAWPVLEPDILMDFEKNVLPFQEEDFDHILLIDVIEHLEKDNGKRLVEQCKSITTDKIFLFTPLFWTDNAKNVEDPKCWAYGNEYDYHKSLWSEKEDFVDWVTLQYFGPPNRRQWLGYWQK
jgi:cyclopropane fatty-acyl-phospholipid synthase-like methyltransferase